MAIVRIDYSQHRPERFALSVSDVVHSTMHTALGVPAAENFIICQPHPDGTLMHAPGQCPPARRDQIVFIQITLNLGRSPELKERFFAQLNQALVATGQIAPEDIYVNLVEVARENWSFGRCPA